MLGTKGWLAVAVMGLCVGAARPLAAQSLLVVSLGDSSASGEGNPDQEGGVGSNTVRWRGTSDSSDGELAGFDDECHRSSKAGPRLAADAFRASAGVPVTFKSFACTGASTDDLIDHWQHSGLDPSEWFARDVPPQLEQLAARYRGHRIDALILNIGINDVGFGDGIRDCMLPNDCTATEDRANTDRRYDTLQGRYQDIQNRIRALGLDVANVFINEYPNGTTKTDGSPCNGGLGAFEPFNYINSNESARAAELIGRLNRLIGDRAQALAGDGWHAMTGLEGRFIGHGFCADDRWLRQFNESLHTQGNWNGAMHPNGVGHQQYAAVIGDALATLRPPPPPQLGTLMDADKTLRIIFDAKVLWLPWRVSSRATQVQLAFRPLSSDDRPPPAPPQGVLADPPRTLTWVNGWQYLTSRAGDGARAFPNTAASYDFAARACTDAACSPWTPVVHVGLVPPSGLAPGAMFDQGITVKWTAGLAVDPARTAYDLAWLRRGPGESWQYQQVPPGFSQVTVNVAAAGTYYFWLRACGVSLCSAWTSARISNAWPAAPSAVTLGAAPFPYAGFTSYGWQDHSDNEVAFQLFIYNSAAHGYDLDETAENAPGVFDYRRGYAWVRACSDRGCSSFMGVASPTPDLLVPHWIPAINAYIPMPPPPPAGTLPAPTRRPAYEVPLTTPSNAWPR